MPIARGKLAIEKVTQRLHALTGLESVLCELLSSCQEVASRAVYQDVQLAELGCHRSNPPDAANQNRRVVMATGDMGVY